jgi:hypothetical protein
MDKKTAVNSDWKSLLAQLESQLQLYLGDKAPSIPKEWKELMVKIAPWLTLVMAVLALPAIVAILGLGSFVLPLSYVGGMRAGMGFTISWVFSLVILVLDIMASPGLFKRTRQAWYLLYYASLLGAVQSVISFNLGGLIIGTLLSLYLLFQVKEYYK